MARPETSETSCSADGPPSRTATGTLAHAAGSQPDQSPAKTTSRHEIYAAVAANDRGNLFAQPAHVAGVAVGVIDDEIGVLLADRRAAHAHSLQPQPVNQRARRRPVGRIAEEAARRRHAQWLMGLPPAADVIQSGT